MIKLQDILNESSYKPNEPIGKVMTDRDHPPFMTEEQWTEKWSQPQLHESGERVKILSERLGITESQARKNIPLLKKLMFKLLNNRSFLHNPKVQKPIQKYLMTGKLNNAEIEAVYQEVRLMLTKLLTGVAIAALLPINMYVAVFASTVVWTLAYLIASSRKLVNIFMPRDIGKAEYWKFQDNIDKNIKKNPKINKLKLNRPPAEIDALVKQARNKSLY